METPKNYRSLFREKRSEVHTPEEILHFFESSFCACFALAEDRTPGARMQLFGKLWEINPDAIITSADLFVVQADPVAARDQYLVISKNGSPEINNLLGHCLEESGIIKEFWLVYAQKRGGVKQCYRHIFDSNKPAVVHKANLMLDGDDLLLTVRHLSSADHAQIKAEKNA